MNNINFINWARHSVSFRIAIIGMLALLLLIPVEMVESLIHEREHTKRVAVSEISQKWGGQQTIAGPILSVPYEKYIVNEKGESVSITQYAHFLPETLLIDGELKPQIRSRGIFDAVVYSSKINFSGKFIYPNIEALGIKDQEINLERAFISVGISDTRGIENDIKFNWNNIDLRFKPGVQNNDVICKNGQNDNHYYQGREKPMLQAMEIGQSSGISVRLPASVEHKNQENYEFSFQLDLNGSQDMQFVPVGKTTEIKLKSDWNLPSFNGAFLPDTRVIRDNGFNATWNIFDLNRGYPQSWIGNAYNIYSSASGVKLLAGIDGYKKATRSLKYALLIIVFTFLVFFFIEVFNRKRIHPIQYILVGLAIVLFYALLISISEIFGFGIAYLSSSVVTIGLITLYSKNALASIKMTMIQGLILVFLYFFVYIILQLENYALLVGSIFLFLILAIVMYLSRKIDWYEINNNMQNK